MSSKKARLALALALVALAVAGHRFRRAFIQAVFLDGPGDALPPVLPLPAAPAPALGPAARVRVVLLDGVGLSTANALPHYSSLCAEGHDLIMDIGFPTVSFPVQHVLWTGLTQAQSGILFQGKAQILAALGGPGASAASTSRPAAAGPRLQRFPSIPAQISGSVAVAESHAYIIHGLDFAEVMPPSPTELPAGWQEHGFMAAATQAMAGDARLAFVHVLGVDTAGHRSGGRYSARYQGAAAGADAILGQLIAAERAVHAGGTRWFVLSDHGHRGIGLYGRGGGHGDVEPELRLVRACIAGELGSAPPARGATLHLIDMARAIADSLAVPLSPQSAGRPLYAAIRAADSTGATLPAPAGSRVAWALVVIALALVITGWAAAGRQSRMPWWWPIALLSVVTIAAVPSLSVPMVYQPLGRVIYMAALPGLVVLALLAARALERTSAIHVLLAQMALPMAAALAAAILCSGAGFVAIAVGTAGEPPLMPWWTGLASVLIVLVYAGAVILAVAMLTSIVASWLRERARVTKSRH